MRRCGRRKKTHLGDNLVRVDAGADHTECPKRPGAGAKCGLRVDQEVTRKYRVELWVLCHRLLLSRHRGFAVVPPGGFHQMRAAGRAGRVRVGRAVLPADQELHVRHRLEQRLADLDHRRPGQPLRRHGGCPGRRVTVRGHGIHVGAIVADLWGMGR